MMNTPQQQGIYTRYSTSFKYAIASGLLEDKTLPPSSISSWKKVNFKNYKGSILDDRIEQTKALHQALVKSKRYEKACKGVLILFTCCNKLIEMSGKRNKLQREAKDVLINAYEDAKKFISIKTICKRLKVKSSKIAHWKNEGKCAMSVIEKCPSIYPSQLTFDEQLRIRNYLYDPRYENMYINHIWAQAQRDGLMVSESTFYAYANKILGERRYFVQESKIVVPVKAKYAFQILHMDSTRIRCENGERVYVHFIMDNFSKAILGAEASYSSKSSVVAENLKQTIKRYNLQYKSFELYCDDGPENHGYVTKLLDKPYIKIEKIVANYNTEKSNNMIEAWNKKFKQIVLIKFKPKSVEHLVNILPEMLEYINHMKLPILKTLSPNEVLAGLKYEDLNLSEKMLLARKERLQKNRNLNCRLACLN